MPIFVSRIGFGMKKTILTILLTVVISTVSFSQQWKTAPLELFGGVSLHQYFGDIGGSPGESSYLGLLDFKFSMLRPGLNLGARYQIMKPLTLKVSYSFGVLSETDKNSRYHDRNFAFNTIINQIAVGAEFYLIPESDENYYYSIMQIRGGLRHYHKPFSLYTTLGVGGLFLNVTPRESLVHSPRFDNSRKFTLSIPMGVGAKYALIPKIQVGAEVLLHLTLTDHLDGYTTKFSTFNDIFYTANLTATYKIQQTRKRNVGLPRRRRFF